ncbi:MAG: SDR family oxidoreductase [Elusimicrobia bacterium]|nr:SDR family oxidoreductase [Elusimicrobiota bacterium]
MKLKNKVAIITGGAGGIGQAIVKSFLKEGAQVVIAETDGPALKNTLAELKSSYKNKIIGIKTDISKAKQVNRLINSTIAKYGTVDILVNTAGLQKPIGPLTEVKDTDWIKNIHTNIIGTMLCCKYVLPVMISKKKGKIINFSGGGATFPRVNFAAYASSKAAIVRFTETIAEEVKKFRIDINAISPGAVYTRMLEEIIQAGAKSGECDLSTAVKIRNEGKTSPKPAADLCIFLASNESDGITGKLISASWDDWKNFRKHLHGIKNSSLFTLRRVDGKKIIELPRVRDRKDNLK